VFKNTGLLKYASENLADKARKAWLISMLSREIGC
jgi:hypothetical protein